MPGAYRVQKTRLMKNEMLINVSQPEECRIAIVEDGLLEELYVERTSADNFVGNIYKGRVVNLEPSIQAAFVDFGVGRNGFLHISDVEPQYFRQGGFDPSKEIALDGNGRPWQGRGDADEVDVGDDPEDEHEEVHSAARQERGRGRSGPGGRGRNGGPHQRRFRRDHVRPRIKPPIQDIFRRGDEVVVQVIK